MALLLLFCYYSHVTYGKLKFRCEMTFPGANSMLAAKAESRNIYLVQNYSIFLEIKKSVNGKKCVHLISDFFHHGHWVSSLFFLPGMDRMKPGTPVWLL